MIIKLTLENEHSNCIYTFLQSHQYLRILPVEASSIKDFKKYIRIIKLPEETIENDEVVTISPSEDEKKWICDVIRKAFYEFTENREDKEYMRGNFSVEIPDTCDAKWANGHTYFVFPTSYTSIPVLNF